MECYTEAAALADTSADAADAAAAAQSALSTAQAEALTTAQVAAMSPAQLQAIEVGGSHVLAMKDFGIFAWGSNAAGQTTGVLGVHISWKWAGEIRDAIFGPVTRHRTVEPLIVSSTNVVQCKG